MEEEILFSARPAIHRPRAICPSAVWPPPPSDSRNAHAHYKIGNTVHTVDRLGRGQFGQVHSVYLGEQRTPHVPSHALKLVDTTGSHDSISEACAWSLIPRCPTLLPLYEMWYERDQTAFLTCLCLSESLERALFDATQYADSLNSPGLLVSITKKGFDPDAAMPRSSAQDEALCATPRGSSQGAFPMSVSEAAEFPSHPLALTLAANGSIQGRHGVWPKAFHCAEEDVFCIAADIALALAGIHSVGLVHGDIRTANVLLRTAEPHRQSSSDFWQHFVVALSDYGLSHLAILPKALVEADGDGRYMPSEMRTSPPGDMFAFGLVLIECLTGIMLPGGGDQYAYLRNGPKLPPLSRSMHRLVTALLNPNPELRPTARDVLRWPGVYERVARYPLYLNASLSLSLQGPHCIAVIASLWLKRRQELITHVTRHLLEKCGGFADQQRESGSQLLSPTLSDSLLSSLSSTLASAGRNVSQQKEDDLSLPDIGDDDLSLPELSCDSTGSLIAHEAPPLTTDDLNFGPLDSPPEVQQGPSEPKPGVLRSTIGNLLLWTANAVKATQHGFDTTARQWHWVAFALTVLQSVASATTPVISLICFCTWIIPFIFAEYWLKRYASTASQLNATRIAPIMGRVLVSFFTSITLLFILSLTRVRTAVVLAAAPCLQNLYTRISTWIKIYELT